MQRRAVWQSLLAAAVAPGAFAQSRSAAAAWPTQPVKLLIGFPAGSVQDLSARSIAPGLAAALGQPVLVDSKAGASGTIAADAVAKAAASAAMVPDAPALLSTSTG
ncbi:MAG: tripartite tricarboxylate transporter substrate binding protein, partial [Comamonadaceae bacterium]